ncbi:hypothetical protein H2198_001787 [Neophaeococcomyces mojaviensis]|uniref:Uncharacterized protein n=1 Tax=Neophaeococcomyces mojaviensis TaxID=3383035 RepID=A0ACC3AGE6_9EURO|nr:hypothetical protein H2198_001787 [Knufia sp. JES_112]
MLFSFFFGFGNIIYIGVLLLNAVAILSEDRFLARIGMGRNAYANVDPGFGARQPDTESVKYKLVVLINSTRTVMRAPLIVVNAAIITYLLVAG